MSRPKLEVASWIAGILSALAALYALIPSSTSDTRSQPTSLVATPKPAPAAANAAPAANEPKPPPSSISAALDAAKQLYYTSDKDAELERLALLALRRHEYSAALEAVNEIYYTSKKDELLDLVHCYSTYMGDPTTAKRSVEKVWSTSTKTTMLKRTASFASTSPGEGPNEIPCRAL